MSYPPNATASRPMVLQTTPTLRQMSDQEFFDFCQLNELWCIEQTKQGDLVIESISGGEMGRRKALLNALFGIWAKQDRAGVGFSSSTGFHLPNGAKRSPDLAWVKREQWEALTADERKVFPPICPDFVVELRSATDMLAVLQEKMDEYIENGASLGWLIDPTERTVHIYRPSQSAEILQNPATVSGEGVLPGFTLELAEIWD